MQELLIPDDFQPEGCAGITYSCFNCYQATKQHPFRSHPKNSQTSCQILELDRVIRVEQARSACLVTADE